MILDRSSGASATLEPEGSEVPRTTNSLGRKFTGYACDLADRAAVYAFIEKVKRECAPIDILVNNASRFCA
jgi:2-deoxy-D-gluconate 3-dehydrogenase